MGRWVVRSGRLDTLRSLDSAAALPLSTTLTGTWELRSRLDYGPSGDERFEPSLGSDPIAPLIYDGRGHFAAQFMKRDRSDPSDSGLGPGGGNNSRVVGGYDAYFGTYTVDDERATVTQRLTAALAPENVGLELTRVMDVDGDDLTITIDMTVGDEPVTRILRWRRVG